MFYYYDTENDIECPGLDGLSKYWKPTIDKAVEYKRGDFQEVIENLLEDADEDLECEILDYLKQYKKQEVWASELWESYK